MIPEARVSALFPAVQAHTVHDCFLHHDYWSPWGALRYEYATAVFATVCLKSRHEPVFDLRIDRRGIGPRSRFREGYRH